MTNEKAKNMLEEYMPYLSTESWKECYQLAINALEKADKVMDWIPVTYRELTDEEREWYSDDVAYIFDCPLPDDGDEILISQNNGKWISVTVFCNGDYGVGDEDGNDWIYDVEAWMPLPKGYFKEEKR